MEISAFFETAFVVFASRFISESEILKSKIFLFRRIFWRTCDQVRNDGAFWDVII